MRLAKVEFLFAVSLLPALAGAQATKQLMPRDYPGVQTNIGGIFVTPVPNFPFTADVEIVSHIKTTDGSEHVVTTTEHIARTSSGPSAETFVIPPEYKVVDETTDLAPRARQ